MCKALLRSTHAHVYTHIFFLTTDLFVFPSLKSSIVFNTLDHVLGEGQVFPCPNKGFALISQDNSGHCLECFNLCTVLLGSVYSDSPLKQILHSYLQPTERLGKGRRGRKGLYSNTNDLFATRHHLLFIVSCLVWRQCFFSVKRRFILFFTL